MQAPFTLKTIKSKSTLTNLKKPSAIIFLIPFFTY